MQLALNSGEVLIHQGSAKYQSQADLPMNEGQLFLTNSRLVFIDDRPEGQTEVILKEIQSLQKCWTKDFGVVPLFENQLKVQTLNNESKFIVESPGYWIDMIRV